MSWSLPNVPSVATDGLAYPTAIPAHLGMQPWDLHKVMQSLYEVNSTYFALRTFLQVNHPELLEQFDTAFAAQKRLGVGHASNNQTTNP